jgi:lipoate-protein ligase A
MKTSIPVIQPIALEIDEDADHLVADEYLLHACDQGLIGPSLRLWQVRGPMVVLGYGNVPEKEVHVVACQQRGIPMHRRSSGGGAVYLDAGCLNYSLLLPIDSHVALASVTTTNQWIMERQRQILSSLLEGVVTCEGDTDLAWEGIKVSGNAQRRLRQACLFHGSILCKASLEDIGQVLSHPSREPSYREGRPHAQFVRNTELDPAELAEALLQAWCGQPMVTTHHPIQTDLWWECQQRLKSRSVH